MIPLRKSNAGFLDSERYLAVDKTSWMSKSEAGSWTSDEARRLMARLNKNAVLSPAPDGKWYIVSFG